MFTRCILFVCLVGLGWAQPQPKKVAMVLSAQGNPKVVTGQMWSAGDHFEMPAGSKVTLLLLNKGQRVELSGQGSVDVSAGGLATKGTQSKVLTSTQVRLAVSGENQRQIGGMTLRNKPNELVWNSPLDRIAISPEGVVLSRPAGVGSPPRLQFCFEEPAELPNLAENFKLLAESSVPASSVFVTQADGLKAGLRWQWQAPWPLEDPPKGYNLKVFELPSKKLLLLTRLHHADALETSNLAAAVREARQWTKREPHSIEPWVYLSTVLADKGRLEESLSALNSAQALRPADPGLSAMKVRLLLDLGRYRQASELLTPAK